jgi:trk system potassium uptake protein TrkA
MARYSANRNTDAALPGGCGEEVTVVHVVIVGCGRVGSSLARSLIGEGYTVAVVDRRPAAFERLGANFQGQMVAGIGFDRDLLVKAGIEKAEAVAAVTNGDNSNILIARVARETFGIERVVARIYDPKRAAVYQRLGIATVAPALWTTERVLRRLVPDAPAVEWVDPSAKVSLVVRSFSDAWAGTRVLEAEGAGVRVVAVGRLGSAILPTADLVVQDGDVVYLAVAQEAMAHLTDLTLSPPAGGGAHQ